MGSAAENPVVSRLAHGLFRTFGGTRLFRSLPAAFRLANGHAAPWRNANARRTEDAEEVAHDAGSAGSRTDGPPGEISELSPEQLSGLWFIGRP
jgi:hypothetical protein